MTIYRNNFRSENLIKQQRKEYFETVFLHFLYYNVSEGYSRTINIWDLEILFAEVFQGLKKGEAVLNTMNEALEEYALRPSEKDGVVDLKERIVELQKKPEYSKMFHLEGDNVVIDDEFSCTRTGLQIWQSWNSHLRWFQKLIRLSRSAGNKIRNDRYFKQEGLSPDELWEMRFLEGYKDAPYEETIIEHLCKSALLKMDTPKRGPENEGVTITENDIEQAKYLAANLMNHMHLFEDREAYLEWGRYSIASKREALNKESEYHELTSRLAYLIATCQPGHVIFNAQYSAKDWDGEPDKDEAELLFRAKYILGKTLDELPNCHSYPLYEAFKDNDGNVLLLDYGINRECFGPLNLNALSENDKIEFFPRKAHLDSMEQAMAERRAFESDISSARRLAARLELK